MPEADRAYTSLRAASSGMSDALSGMWTDIVLGRGERFAWDLFGTGTLRSIWQDRIEP